MQKSTFLRKYGIESSFYKIDLKNTKQLKLSLW